MEGSDQHGGLIAKRCGGHSSPRRGAQHHDSVQQSGAESGVPAPHARSLPERTRPIIRASPKQVIALGLWLNTARATDEGSMGLTASGRPWRPLLTLPEELLIAGSLGGGIHAGHPNAASPDRTILGPRLLFRERVEAGYQRTPGCGCRSCGTTCRMRGWRRTTRGSPTLAPGSASPCEPGSTLDASAWLWTRTLMGRSHHPAWCGTDVSFVLRRTRRSSWCAPRIPRGYDADFNR